MNTCAWESGKMKRKRKTLINKVYVLVDIYTCVSRNIYHYCITATHLSPQKIGYYTELH